METEHVKLVVSTVVLRLFAEKRLVPERIVWEAGTGTLGSCHVNVLDTAPVASCVAAKEDARLVILPVTSLYLFSSCCT
jgi:hypothetical protein